jgi:hypothetical protein
MRDLDTIDSELRLVFRAWRVGRHMSGCRPSTIHIDELLDERSAATFPTCNSYDRARPAGNREQVIVLGAHPD